MGPAFTQCTCLAVVGITCQLFTQFNGINAILYFLPENLTRAGFTVSRSLLYVPSEVTLLVAEGDKEGGPRPSLEAKERTLEDVD